MNKRISLQDAVSKVKDGMTVMVGGFLAAGSPIAILDELAQSGVKDLTLICNDTAFADVAHGKLITNKQVKKVIVSHIGTNPNTSEQMNSGELEIEFSPQGTLAERVRAAGAGLGGVLTTTGMGTVVAFLCITIGPWTVVYGPKCVQLKLTCSTEEPRGLRRWVRCGS